MTSLGPREQEVEPGADSWGAALREKEKLREWTRYLRPS